MATIKDVARRAGVSVSTVSYAISGDRPISAPKKAIIEEAMKELDYRPHAIARSLASKRTRILALLMTPEERGIGLSELSLITSASRSTAAKGYHLVLWTMSGNDLAELDRQLRHELVDGVILMEVHNADPRIPVLQARNIPFFPFGRDDSLRNESFVDTDFEQTMYLALSHLVGLGHRSICFVNQSGETLKSGYGPVVRAHETFKRLVREMQLDGTELLSPADPLAGYRLCSERLAAHKETTAFLVMNDKVLSGVLKACADAGMSVPGDVSVVAIASSEGAATMMIPSVTAWEMEGEALMELAVGELIAKLDGTYFEVPRRLIPCRLVERSSSGPARGTKQKNAGRR